MFLHLGVRMLNIYLMMVPIVGLQIVGSSFFSAIGKPKQAFLLSLTRQCIILVPLVVILPRFFDLDGILYSGPIADLFSTIITIIWLVVGLKQLEITKQIGGRYYAKAR